MHWGTRRGKSFAATKYLDKQLMYKYISFVIISARVCVHLYLKILAVAFCSVSASTETLTKTIESLEWSVGCAAIMMICAYFCNFVTYLHGYDGVRLVFGIMWWFAKHIWRALIRVYHCWMDAIIVCVHATYRMCLRVTIHKLSCTRMGLGCVQAACVSSERAPNTYTIRCTVLNDWLTAWLTDCLPDRMEYSTLNNNTVEQYNSSRVNGWSVGRSVGWCIESFTRFES